MMGLFDFLKRKKDDDLEDFGGGFGPEPAFPKTGTREISGIPQTSAESPQLFSNQAMPPPPGTPPVPAPVSMNLSQPMQERHASGNIELIASRIEVISSKIDSLRASMERLNEKLDYIERFLAASGGGRRYG
jgi:hypothetical protein